MLAWIAFIFGYGAWVTFVTKRFLGTLDEDENRSDIVYSIVGYVIALLTGPFWSIPVNFIQAVIEIKEKWNSFE